MVKWNPAMLIKAFCEAAGLPRDTVRFYVKRGLLSPAIGSRPGNRYQVFDDAQVERARLIKSAQRLGFSLREISTFAAAYEARDMTPEKQGDLLRARLVELDEQVRLIDKLRHALSEKLRRLEGAETDAVPAADRHGRAHSGSGNLGADFE